MSVCHAFQITLRILVVPDDECIFYDLVVVIHCLVKVLVFSGHGGDLFHFNLVILSLGPQRLRHKSIYYIEEWKFSQKNHSDHHF
jgi:hypothetical protein